MTPESHRVVWQKISGEICKWRQYCCSAIPRPRVVYKARESYAVSGIIVAVTSTRVLDLSEARISPEIGT